MLTALRLEGPNAETSAQLRMDTSDPHLIVRLAKTPEDIVAAQRLRYDVFVEELGAAGEMVDHETRLERDRFDAEADHLLLEDNRRSDAVVGVYRLIRGDVADALGGYYSEAEYDLSALKSSGRKCLELGRSCLHPQYRGGTAMFQLWKGLASYVLKNEIEVLFGVASFHGTDTGRYAEALSLLHHNFRAAPPLRVSAQPWSYQRMDLVPSDQIDRAAAMRATPALIKAYLRLGGRVGDGAFIDNDFNTIDVCLVMDTQAMSARARRRYAGAPA